MMSDAVILAWIALAGTTINSLISLANNYVVRRSAKAIEQNTRITELTHNAVAETKGEIEVLKKQTNSMTDSLVKTTGEAEYAKGVQAGAAAVKSGNVGDLKK